MWRVIVGPIVGYVAMVAFVVGCIAAAWFSLGPEFAFEDDTFKASLGWTLTMLLSGLVAAIIGGCVAKLIGGNDFGSKAVFGLAGLVLVMGVVTIISQSMFDAPVPPEDLETSGVTFAEAGQFAKSPTWYNYAIIVVGVVGTLIGGSALKGKSATPPA